MRSADDIDWASFAGPDSYDPHRVPRVLHEIELVTPETGGHCYHMFFDAVGHDHSGSLYPAAEAALHPLLELACSGSPAARWAAADILVDLLGCFDMLAVYDEEIDGRNARARMIEAARPTLLRLIQAESTDPHHAREFSGILAGLDDQAGM